MRIQSILKFGIACGIFAFAVKGCQKLEDKMSNDLVKAKENAKMFVKYHSPQKFDSISNLKNADVQVWLDAENQILDSLNRSSIYNKALLNLKDSAKYIK